MIAVMVVAFWAMLFAALIEWYFGWHNFHVTQVSALVLLISIFLYIGDYLL